MVLGTDFRRLDLQKGAVAQGYHIPNSTTDLSAFNLARKSPLVSASRAKQVKPNSRDKTPRLCSLLLRPCSLALDVAVLDSLCELSPRSTFLLARRNVATLAASPPFPSLVSFPPLSG